MTSHTRSVKYQRGGPLQGVRVVELTKVWAGPYAGKQLAYLGAEVIRIESEGSLDVTRVYGVKDINRAPGFQAVNPEKLSAQINMKSDKGINLILDLLKEADIVIENLRPGAIERLGLGYERVKEVNPAIVYTSMGMYGSEGPLAYQTGYAPCFVALGGVSALAGYESEPPTGINIRYADSTFGTAAAVATAAGYYHARRTGEGQFIDVSAVESMTSMIGDAVMDYTLNGHVRQADGNRHEDMAPHGVYPCQDQEWVCIAAGDDQQWQRLATATGIEGLAKDPRFSRLSDRKANETELDAILAEWTRDKAAADLALTLQQQGVAACKSFSSIDLISDHHLWAKGFYSDVNYPDGDSRPTTGPGWTMSRGAAIERGAPSLGQHNAYIFGEVLGLSEEEQAALSNEGVTK
ncbi:CoA transferase [Spongiibacter nanhainus]|uniref:CoA transferase n=1 Tax=Spongiibacter nanhainus TaxID=2794344 RepID=A0A7T4UR64_9GAMM|nr:CoA transferase [Spongiibacter nanhainus]QQD19488.1 CoA transferase [Spongiibacter nanhainus]